MTITNKMLGEKQLLRRQDAARQQIHAAIRMLHDQQFACAVTLALAAEDQMPPTDQPHLFGTLRQKLATDQLAKFNEVRNWLKHHKPPSELAIYKFEVVIALMRATSRFHAAYQADTPEIDGFVQWCRDSGYISAK